MRFGARAAEERANHALADDCARPVAFAVTPASIADISMTIPLLGAVDTPKRLLADEA